MKPERKGSLRHEPRPSKGGDVMGCMGMPWGGRGGEGGNKETRERGNEVLKRVRKGDEGCRGVMRGAEGGHVRYRARVTSDE